MPPCDGETRTSTLALSSPGSIADRRAVPAVSIVLATAQGARRPAAYGQRPVAAVVARWGKTVSEIACRQRSWTDRAATADMAAAAMMYMASTLGLPVIPISQVAT